MPDLTLLFLNTNRMGEKKKGVLSVVINRKVSGGFFFTTNVLHCADYLESRSIRQDKEGRE